MTGSDDEDRTISVRALKAMGEALSKNEPIEDISLYGKELTDEHILAFVAGVAANQHIKTINLGSMFRAFFLFLVVSSLLLLLQETSSLWLAWKLCLPPWRRTRLSMLMLTVCLRQ